MKLWLTVLVLFACPLSMHAQNVDATELVTVELKLTYDVDPPSYRNAKTLKVYAGYFYAEVPLERLPMEIAYLENIDLPRLNAHRDLVAQNQTNNSKNDRE